MIEILITFLLFSELFLTGFLVYFIYKSDKRVKACDIQVQETKKKLVKYFYVARHFLKNSNEKLKKYLKKQEESQYKKYFSTILDCIFIGLFLYKNLKIKRRKV